jgi:uncharacterized membrane-anchored protein
MKAFLTGLVAAIVIAVVAGFALQTLERTSAQVYSTENVRL